MPLFTNEQELLSQPITVDGSGVTQPVSGTVTANAGTGTFTVDGSGFTQPVSGTVTANAGTGTFTVDGSGFTQPISASALPLPSGAATETTVAAISGKLPATLGQKAMAASLSVVIASDQSTVPVSFSAAALTTTATINTIEVSTTVATLSASNVAKTAVIIHNEDGILYVKFGATASSTDYSYRLTKNTVLEITNYAGIVTGTKAVGTTDAQVTEVGI